MFLNCHYIETSGERIRLQFINVLSIRSDFNLKLLRGVTFIKKPYSFSVHIFVLLPTSFFCQWKSPTQETVGDGVIDGLGISPGWSKLTESPCVKHLICPNSISPLPNEKIIIYDSKVQPNSQIIGLST